MNFIDWWINVRKQEYSTEDYFCNTAEDSWNACKKEVLKIINQTPLGYRTEGEHEKLERFADLISEKVEKL